MSQAFRPMSCRFDKLRRFLLSQPRLLHSLRALQNLLFRQQHCFEKYRSDPSPSATVGPRVACRLTTYLHGPWTVKDRVTGSVPLPGHQVPGHLVVTRFQCCCGRCKGCPPIEPSSELTHAGRPYELTLLVSTVLVLTARSTYVVYASCERTCYF